MFVKYKRNKDEDKYGMMYAENEGGYLGLTEIIPDSGGESYEYFYIKDGCEYTSDFEVQELETSPELIEFIKKNSVEYQNINKRINDLIRERYSVNDELKCLRTGDTTEYNTWVEECIATFAPAKANLGF